MTVPQFWHVTFSITRGDGSFHYRQDMGDNELDARTQAIIRSHEYGSATITNREGLVASYISGVEQFDKINKFECRLPGCLCSNHEESS